MPIKLILTRESDPASQQELEFDQELITIGRDQENMLYLPDNEKKLVSRRHAQIARRGETFELTDLESRNATFLNGSRIEPKRDYPLQDGDTIKIGDFTIAFVERRAPVKTAVQPEVPLPPAPENSGQLNKELGEQLQQAQSEIHLLREENQRLLAATRTENTYPAETSSPRFKAVLEVLLEATAKAIQAPAIFKSEFEGVSVMIPKEYGSAQALHEHLLNPALSDAEAAKRLVQAKQALERDFKHQGMGLLEGYKTSVQEGARQLLQYLAPTTVKQKAAEKKLRLGPLEISYRYLPIFWQWKALQLYRQKHEELINETRGVVEKRIFRPAFSKGYHAVMDSI